MVEFIIYGVLLILSLAKLPTASSQVEIGSATTYGVPQYIPNACDVSESQFPSDGMFASAGEAIWDNGAACGRTYRVKCTSAASPGDCLPDTVVVIIVDRASTLAYQPLLEGCSLVFSEPAFHKIATKGTKSIDLGFELV